MNEKNTHAVPGNQHDEAVCKLQTYTMTRVSLLVMYSSPGGQAREVQRMIVYKMTHPRLTCDPVRLASRVLPAVASSGNSVRMLGKSRIAYDVPGRRPGLDRARCAFLRFLAARLTLLPSARARLDRVQASSSNRVLLVFSMTSFAKLVTACLTCL
jgi:hypothetical protein